MIKPSWRASFLISLLSRRSRLATSRSCTSMAQLVYFILRPCAISSWARAHSKWLLPAPGFPNRSKFSWRSRKLPSTSAFSCRPALTGKRFRVEVCHRLLPRQTRLAQQCGDAVPPSSLALPLCQLQQVLLVAECLFLGLVRGLLEALAHRRQMQLFQVLHQRRSDLRGRAHGSTSCALNRSKTRRSTAATCTSRTVVLYSAPSMASIPAALICSSPGPNRTSSAASTLTSLSLAANSRIFRYCLLP